MIDANPLPGGDGDRLARAESALKAAPIPDGPSPALVARTLAALRSAEESPIRPFPNPRSRPMLLAMTKVAAAVLAVAGGMAYLASSRPATAAMAFEAVARKLHDARTLSYRQVVTPPGGEPVAIRVLYRDPGRTRQEMPGGGVVLTDAVKGGSLILDPAEKIAVVTKGGPKDDEAKAAECGERAMMEALRALAPKEGKPAGEKEIGGVRASGFRVVDGEADLTIWVDPKAQVPLEIEVAFKLGDKASKVVMDQIAIDPAIDEALFRLDVPAGYRVEAGEDDEIKPEDAVAAVLKLHAAKFAGRFPASLDDPAAIRPALDGIVGVKGKDPAAEKERSRLFSGLGVIAASRFTLADRGYRPEGVKLGDADKVVFWYRPEGSTKYRALFGDLHKEEVEAARLPKAAEGPR